MPFSIRLKSTNKQIPAQLKLTLQKYCVNNVRTNM